MHVVDFRLGIAESKMEDFWFRLAFVEYFDKYENGSEHPARFRGVPVGLS
jgi:hypothetical protein